MLSGSCDRVVGGGGVVCQGIGGLHDTDTMHSGGGHVMSCDVM